MAKVSAVEKNKRRERMVKRYAARRARLKAIVMNQEILIEERFKASIQLAGLPRNSAKVRVRNRCEVSGRPRAYYRKLKMSRIALRDLGSLGYIPGIVKSSW
ncbi:MULTISPECIES: 30S ribosomal protein S14 [unclassified Bartonella]|uniref:30S ribosomal protein S14 n=1 Tax=unclassified Bartonella TaxID=2645622 RepID=UPI000998EB2C|nr:MULTISPECIES: 30S ribosomal protein S14 [unclassified Bartonella]AQX28173.1 SSU ribosomal protein S14P [Bartonella sp. JB15]AQX29444.1 SSU ribosomal protein S14P [Bartonella sp. JB63]